MHTWPVIIALSLLSLIMGFYYLFKRDESSKAQVFLLTSYGIISSAFLLILVTIWHYHPVWGEWIHRHPESHLSEIVIFHIGPIHVDLLTVAVLGATALFYTLAIIYSQMKLRILYYEMERRDIATLSTQLSSTHRFLGSSRLFVVEDPSPHAFSFSRITSIFSPTVIDTIVVTTGLISILNDDELEVVLAHEHAHCHNHDTRYAHLIVTLRALMRYDPVLKLFENRLNFHQELQADTRAAEITGKPRDLAMALLKLMEFRAVPMATNLISGSSQLTILRIERLITMVATC